MKNVSSPPNANNHETHFTREGLTQILRDLPTITRTKKRRRTRKSGRRIRRKSEERRKTEK